MKLRSNYLFVIFPLLLIGFALTNKKFSDPNKDRLLMEVVKYVVEKGHYKKISIDDNLSENLYHSFIKQLDNQKRFFLKSDIREFEKYKYLLDDQIKEYDLSFFNLVYQRSKIRIEEAKSYYEELVNNKFNFNLNENIDLDFEKKEYARSKSEIKNRWRKQLKFSTLDIATLKLGDTLNIINDRIYNESIAIVKKNTEDYFEFITDLDRDDWYSNYLNAFLTQLDPHTYYFQPEDKERFDVNISGKFTGIGARLTKTEGNIKVVEIIIGGPVWKDKLLDVGDIIIKVAQENEEPVDIVGMKVDDAIKLIKGPEKSIVSLTVKKLDGSIKEVQITRALVELEELYAKSTLIEEDDIRYGYISLPKFYVDFSNYKNRNSAEDVKNEIIKLKNNGIEGLILDLRNNGGGSLQSVVDMTGLFIERGPIVQIRYKNNRVEVFTDRDKNITYEGPLAVMVNRLSASASEIFAGAIQDYRRGIVIGSQTFGKGTVKTIVPLILGQLKLTQMKFYRVSGESNQHRGIIPDIIYPDNFDPEVIGESALDGPLPWDTIPATRYPVASRESELITRLNNSHQSRIKSDPDFIYEQSAIAFQRKQAKKEFRSLNEFTRINDKNNTEVFWLGLENQRRKDKGLTTISSLDELDSDLSNNQKNPLDSKTNFADTHSILRTSSLIRIKNRFPMETKTT